jgi:predicted DNA-binding WGR domain protein
MRRFEFVEGSSNKFWEVEVAGDTLTVRYGRNGTHGQTQTKTFASTAKAQTEHDKLIREKTGKGYVEVGAAASAHPAPAPVVPSLLGNKAADEATAPVVPSLLGNKAADEGKAAEQAPLHRSTGTCARTESRTIVAEPQPPGQFLWTPHWRKLLPIWRGEPAPPLPQLSLEDGLIDLRRRAEAVRKHGGRHFDASLKQLMASMGMDIDDASIEVPAALIATPADGAAWARLVKQAIVASQVVYSDLDGVQLQQVWQVAAAAHGLPFAIDALFQGLQAAPRTAVNCWTLARGAGLGELLARIAGAADSEYAQICEVAARHAQRGELPAVLAACLLPTEPTRVADALAHLSQAASNGDIALLASCVLSPEQARALADAIAVQPYLQFDSARLLMLDLARLHLPQAVELTLKLAKGVYATAEQRRASFDILRAHDSPEALAELLARVEDKDARPIADAFARQWPQLAIRLAAESIAASGQKSLREWLERFAAAHGEHLQAARAGATPEIRSLLESLAARQREIGPEAAAQDLPDWLNSPPWRGRERAAAAPYPKIVPHDIAPCLAWAEGERARWLGGRSPESVRAGLWHQQLKGLSGDKLVRGTLGVLGVRDGAHAQALAGARLSGNDLTAQRWVEPGMLMLLPPLAARVVLEAKDPREWSEWGESKLDAVVAWLDAAAVPALEAFAERAAERGLQLAQPLASVRVATVAASALRASKKAKPAAQAWLLRHAQLAADALLPQLGDPRHGEDASFALRWLLGSGREDAVEAAADGYGVDGRAALATLRAFDPMNLAPLKVPKLPAFWLPAAYARVQLTDGRTLPLAVIDAIGEMLAFSPLEQRYAGLDRLRALCKPASLGAFAWDLFQSWLTAGAPSKESWAFTALAHLGDDECARKLALLIRAWPGEAAHARAVTGLDVLAAIGSDVALMHLNGIAQKVKFKGLQEKARARIDQMAQARGLTAEELADRLVPDLGLDEHGTLVLDFGSRQFTVGFDETLKPFARDARGAPLKDLPKPIKSDDAALAADASERWKALKKDARTLASQQIQRLELAMAQRRRWSAVEFRRFFVEHPLLRHLARRLLWARFEEGKPVQCLRVAEDLSYADANDDLLTLPDDADIGLVHPLELAPADAAAFGQIYADYEILQPFAQLGREVYRLTADDLGAFELARFKGKQVATGSMFGLENRGWRRGDPQDGGWVGWFTRRVADDLEVELDLDPGTVVGDISYEPKQKLGALALRRPNSYGDDGRRRWGEIDPILASEVLRDIDRLAAVG